MLKKLEELREELKNLAYTNTAFSEAKRDDLRLETGSNLTNPNTEILKFLLPKITACRRLLAEKIGYIVPIIRVCDNVSLNPNEYILYAHEIKIANGNFYTEKYMVSEKDFEKAEKVFNNIEKIEDIDPLTQEKVYWINKTDFVKYFSGITAKMPVDILVEHIKKALIENADKIITLKEIEKYSKFVSDNYSKSLAKEIAVIGCLKIKFILSELIKKGFSIKDIGYVYEQILSENNSNDSKEILLAKIEKDLQNI